MRYLLCIPLFTLLHFLAYSQPEQEYSGIMKHLSRSVTRSVCRNVLTITHYASIAGKPDSLTFHRTEGLDVLAFQWKSDGYQAFFSPAEQDSSFILRFDVDNAKWFWGCKSKLEFPTAMHWNPILGDSTSYILFTGPPRNGYERLLLLTYMGYALRQDEISIPLVANKKKKKPWGSFFSMVGKGQKNWYLHSEKIGKQMMTERLRGPIKRHVLSGTGAVGEMAVYKRK